MRLIFIIMFEGLYYTTANNYCDEFTTLLLCYKHELILSLYCSYLYLILASSGIGRFNYTVDLITPCFNRSYI